MRSAWVLPVLLAACASGAVRLDAAVSQGRILELALHNGSAQPIGYNLCASGLERRSEGGWQAVPSTRACTMELRTLAPGEAARFGAPLGQLPPGEYRAVTGIDGHPAGGVHSEPFIVR
jgi:hypothetical protein